MTREQRELPVWRSLLYVPVNVERFVEKAHLRGADCIQLDLEDSVPVAEKAVARTLVPDVAVLVARGGADVVVRINRPLTMAVRDLESSICPAVHGIAITKAESESHVALLDEVVTELEAERGMVEGTTSFIAMVETPEAFFKIESIARASKRIVGLVIGGEDFALNTGMEPTGEALFYPKQHMVFAAYAAGVMPLGFIDSVAGFGDWDAFRVMVRRSRSFGFMGASCIHPGQVAIVNEEYRPSADEVAYAERIITADDENTAAGRGSFALDGKMIDIPVVERARRLLKRDAAIRARESKLAAVIAAG